MGWYVEFQTKVIKLKKDTNPFIISFLHNAINLSHSIRCSNHKFFEQERWKNVFHKSGFLDDEPFFKKDQNGNYLLYIHCEINNGNLVAEEFINFITPYIVGHKPKEYVGWYKGDEWDNKRVNLYAIKGQECDVEFVR